MRSFVLIGLFLLLVNSLFAQTYKGTIGNLPIFLKLEHDAKNASAYYCYHKTVSDILLKGNWTPKNLSLSNQSDYDNNIENLELTADGTGWKGTWKKNEKTLPVILVPLEEPDMNCKRLTTNKQLDEAFTKEYDRAKIGLFHLKSLDSVIVVNRIKLRFFEEAHSQLIFFRVDSGLPKLEMDWVNQFLETMHIRNFIFGSECSIIELNHYTYQIHVTEFFCQSNFLSFKVRALESCYGIRRPEYYEYAIIVDLKSQRQLFFEDLVNHLAYEETSLKRPFDEKNLNQWESKMITYFTQKNPEKMHHLFEEEIEAELKKDDDFMDCNYASAENWSIENGAFLTNNGLKLLLPISDLLYDCRFPEWTIIPYSELNGLIEPTFLNRLLTIKPN